MFFTFIRSFVMSGSHFYLTLPSNASMDVFPDNKTTGYRVQLPQIVNLEGDWEVGLYSISYPNTWYTLQNHQNHIYCSTNGQTFLYSAMIDYGYYASMADVIKSINVSIKKELGNSKISFSFNPRTEIWLNTNMADNHVGVVSELNQNNYCNPFDSDKISEHISLKNVVFDGQRIKWCESYELLKDFLKTAFNQQGKWCLLEGIQRDLRLLLRIL